MWEINYPYITNKKDMFRLDELYDERDEYYELNEDEIDVRDMLFKETGNL